MPYCPTYIIRLATAIAIEKMPASRVPFVLFITARMTGLCIASIVALTAFHT